MYQVKFFEGDYYARQLAANQAGAVFELEVNGVVRRVVFRHHEPPAFVATPFLPRLNQQHTDYFTATIKLMTI